MYYQLVVWLCIINWLCGCVLSSGCVVVYYKLVVWLCIINWLCGCVLSILNFSWDLFYGYVIIQHRMLERWMNDGTGREFEGSGHSRIPECLEGLRTIRIAGIPGNVRTAHLPNITREHYHDCNLLGQFASHENPGPWNWFFRLIQIIPHSLIAHCKT